VQNGNDLQHEGLSISQAIASGLEHHDREPNARHILLRWKIAVHRDKHIEFLLGESE
jgi:hypothetical protein